MAERLTAGTPDFETRFAEFITRKREVSENVEQAVRQIIKDIRTRGDEALIDFTAKFDGLKLDAGALRVSTAEIDAAVAAAPADLMTSLNFARDRIEAHHRRQLPKDDHYVDAAGAELGSRWTAVESVGLNPE